MSDETTRPTREFFGLGRFEPAAIRYIKGDTGDAATVAVGTTTTLPAGSDATVTNSGTDGHAVLNFGIPQGEKGDPQAPSDTTPLTDGTGAAGSATTYSRGDHRHPTDTSRVARTGDTGLTGDFKTTGNIGAASIMARSDVTIGDTSSANGYVDIAHEGVLVASDGTDTTAIAIPGGKQAANPDNTLPVLAMTNQIPAAQVNSDWNAASGVAQILNKPAIPSTPAGVGITTEVWTFTLSDNSTVTKTVCTVAST